MNGTPQSATEEHNKLLSKYYKVLGDAQRLGAALRQLSSCYKQEEQTPLVQQGLSIAEKYKHGWFADLPQKNDPNVSG